jgi:ABC-type sugar transport system substrate-binding protein
VRLVKKLSFLVSLITQDNDYQRLQASSAELAARRLGADIKVIFAGNDSIRQSEQLLEAIQSRSSRPSAIVFEPAGTAMAQAARAAVAAGIGWAVLNKTADYMPELRRACQAPIFSVGSDHDEIGRLLGEQLRALLPQGGVVLCIQGPAGSSAAEQRAAGMNRSKPANIDLRTIRGNWTQESGYNAARSWLRLSTSHAVPIGAVASHNDAMALGASKAFEDQSASEERARLLGLPFLGCDGVPETGQAWVRNGQMAATIITPPNAGIAIEMAAKALQTGTQPAEHTVVPSVGFPSLNELAAKARK